MPMLEVKLPGIIGATLALTLPVPYHTIDNSMTRSRSFAQYALLNYVFFIVLNESCAHMKISLLSVYC